jgi:FKBP-type peptidyl-prolyl cis-trans isomerase SlyD
MSRIETNSVVTLTYRLTDDQGNELENRTPENPAIFIHGHGQILPALEDAVTGKTVGYRATIQVEPKDAYGDYQPDLVVEMPRSQFPTKLEIKIGMKFNTTGPDGDPLTVRVTEFDKTTVTVDGNHPLAGVPLSFEVRVLEVRAATAEEKKNGMVQPARREHLH